MDVEDFKGLKKDEIKKHLLKSVIKSEEEVKKEKAEKKSKSDLKIYLVKSIKLKPDELVDSIYDLLESEDISYHFHNFLDRHNFKTIDLCESVYGLIIYTPEYNKEDHFFIFEEKDYWHIWTTARKYWTGKTIEKMIDKHPKLERIFISPEKLENISKIDLRKGLGDNTHFSGFVAKDKPFYSDKQISINMYGGDYDDLEKVKKEFHAEPTQITISMKNSPTNCVLGHLHGNDGYISLSTILPDYFEWGWGIANMTSKLFENSDREIYDIEEPPIEINVGENGEGYTKFNSYHALILEPKLKKSQRRITEIFDRTIEWLLENKQGYYGYRWDKDTYHMVKKESMDLFQISKEKENLVLYPFDSCSEKTLKKVCKEIIENITGDIEPEPYHSKTRVRA